MNILPLPLPRAKRGASKKPDVRRSRPTRYGQSSFARAQRILGGAKKFLAPVRLDVRTGHFPEIPMAKQSGTERYAGFSAAGAGEVKPKFGRARAAYDEKMLIR